MLYNSSGDLIGGVTAHNGGWFTRLQSDIYISPGIKGYFYSRVNVSKMVINHEFLHAYHQLIKLPKVNLYSERAASTYSLAYTKAYNMNSLIPLFRSSIGNYPASYSWRNLISIIGNGLGIK